MERSRSVELRLTSGALLLDIADAAIVDGLNGLVPTPCDAALLPAELRARRGVFVTLLVGGVLNGCVGTVRGTGPLGQDVGRYAWSSAFADPRLDKLRDTDYDRLVIEVSVLSPLSPIDAVDRSDLLGLLRPNLDGLMLSNGHRQGVFLPTVWEQLPSSADFVDRLQVKAGMVPGSWPAGIRAERFTVEKFSRGSSDHLRPAAHALDDGVEQVVPQFDRERTPEP
jgi:hypothetical protein